MMQAEISIHTLRVEGDAGKRSHRDTVMSFQSTPSAWRVTPCGQRLFTTDCISIHTLRMEGDNDVDLTARTISVFQSTPSAWRVTGRASPMLLPFGYISIHTLRMEGDSSPPGRRHTARHFNPHPPHGG